MPKTRIDRSGMIDVDPLNGLSGIPWKIVVAIYEQNPPVIGQRKSRERLPTPRATAHDNPVVVLQVPFFPRADHESIHFASRRPPSRQDRLTILGEPHVVPVGKEYSLPPQGPYASKQ